VTVNRRSELWNAAPHARRCIDVFELMFVIRQLGKAAVYLEVSLANEIPVYSFAVTPNVTFEFINQLIDNAESI